MKSIINEIEIMGLLLKIYYFKLLLLLLKILRVLIRVGGALLVEAVKILYLTKFLSKEERIIFSACVAVSIYILALVMFIRI